jgi:NCAIR mutase (PurE)-related protein
MTHDDALREILEQVQRQAMSPDEAAARIRAAALRDLGHTALDLDREHRTGTPEIIYCERKETAHVIEIFHAMREAHQNVLGTRVPPAMAEALLEEFSGVEHSELGRTVFYQCREIPPKKGLVLVLCAGTSDLPVVEEAAATLRALGNEVEVANDVGVAGIHRLFARSEQMKRARAIIVAAGMEGALPSVVAGLVAAPVIAVPTSVGYGANFGGVAALLGMLNSCAGGIGVVNIDNGVGAALLANAINRVAQGE